MYIRNTGIRKVGMEQNGRDSGKTRGFDEKIRCEKCKKRTFGGSFVKIVKSYRKVIDKCMKSDL